MGGPEDVIVPDVVFSPEDSAALSGLMAEAHADLNAAKVTILVAGRSAGRESSALFAIGEVERGPQRIMSSLAPLIRDGDVEAMQTFQHMFEIAFELLTSIAAEYGVLVEERPFFQDEWEFWSAELSEIAEDFPTVAVSIGFGAGAVLVVAGVVLWVLRRR